MGLTRLCSQAAITFVTFAVASMARAELPQLQPVQVLTPALSDIQPDPEQAPGEASFGHDVVIKGDVAVVGLSTAHEGAGLVAIFLRDTNGSWVRRATLAPDDAAATQNFGKSVALAGSRLLVASAHAAYLFEGSGDIWQQRQKLTISGTVSDVAFADRLAIIGTGERGSGNNGAQVFRLRADGTLHVVAQLLPSDVQSDDRFGARVAIFHSTVVVTAPGYNGGQGAAYVFTCAPPGCSQRQKLLANDGDAWDSFGDSVDVLGNTLVVGASGVEPVMGDDLQEPSEQNFTAQGAAYVFVRNPNGTWVETQKLRVTPQENNWYFNLGDSVALAPNLIIIGAPYGNTQFEPGKLFVYRRVGSMYVATEQMIGSLGLGTSVSISGNTVLSGAPQEYWYRGEAGVYSIP